MREATILKAAIYCRISRDVAGRALGVERQKQDCLKIAERKGWTVTPDSVYIDNDVSASAFSKKARKEYLRLLSDIEQGSIGAVVMWMEDRTHRQVLELAEFINLCREYNVSVATAGTEYDLSDPDQVSMWFIKVRFAEAEVEKTSKRVRRQRLQAVEKGKPHAAGRRAFGWEGSGEKLVSHEQALTEQELIREAADRILAGDSFRSVALDWTERGITTPGGNAWQGQTLRQMLLAPRIAGYRSHHSKLHPGSWAPIIEPEKWETLRAQFADRARPNSRGGVRKYLLSGILRCGACGHGMVGHARERIGRKPIYHCSNCHRVARLVEPLDELVTTALFEAVESPEFQQTASSNAPGQDDDPTAELYESLANDQGLLDRLEDKVAQELISTEAARRNRTEIERRMDQTRAKLAKLDQTRVKTHIPRNLRTVWPDLSLDRRRAILQAVIERIGLHPQGRSPRFDPSTVKVAWRA